MTTRQITNPAPQPLSVCIVTTDSGDITVPCEVISDSIFITPHFGMDDKGRTWLGGGFVLSHRTGYRLSDGPACIECCRGYGRALADLPIDWDDLTSENAADVSAAWPDDVKVKVTRYRSVMWFCDAEDCERPTFEDGAS